MPEKFSDQVRACGIFFISIVVLAIIPLVYHCMVFLIAVPLLANNPVSGVTLLVCFHLLLVLVLVSYYNVIFTDAGGVPYELDEAWISELNLATRFGLEAGVSERVSDVAEKTPLNALGQERKGDGRQRFCRKCHKFKPDRAHHCKYCGRCVLKMDHHCPWVNNCIGFRNYKFFMLFCGYTTLAAFYICVTLLTGFIAFMFSDDPIDITGEVIEMVIVFILMLATAVALTGFTGFHLYLTLNNMTTIEHVEKRDPTRGVSENPFNVGRRANFQQVFGDNPWKWFVPFGECVKGDGVHWETVTGVTSDMRGHNVSVAAKI